MTQLEPGTVVRLKSGGPKMTTRVRSLLWPDALKCIWFDAQGKFHSQLFNIYALEIIEIPKRKEVN